MKIPIFFVELLLICQVFTADIKSRQYQDATEYKNIKRCSPEYFASEDSSGCLASEEDTKMRTIRQKILVTTEKNIVLPKGPFFDFLVNICNTLLTKFTPYKISKYFNMLGKSLRGLGSDRFMKTLINNFSDKLKKLSQFNGNLLKTNIIKFLKVISEGTLTINDYFFSMNRIFTIWDDNEMDDYIYRLRQYGQGLSRHIGQHTRNIFQGLVFYRLDKKKDDIKVDIELKFKLAVMEYRGEKRQS